jgi:hypothetical protein
MSPRRLYPGLCALAVACAGAGTVPPAPRDMHHGGDLVIPTVDLAGATGDDASFTPGDMAMASSPDFSTGNCTPQTQPCDVICQNCGTGGACTVDGTGTPTCVQAGTVPAYGQCGSGIYCTAGSICVGETATTGMCRPFCRSTGDCPAGAQCSITVINGSTMMTLATACSEVVNNCDPVLQNGCSSGKCYPVVPDGSTGCHPAGPGAVGTSCMSDYDCQGGSVCVGSTPLCYKLCHLGGNDCTGGKSCVMVSYTVNNMTMNWATYGVCN